MECDTIQTKPTTDSVTGLSLSGAIVMKSLVACYLEVTVLLPVPVTFEALGAVKVVIQ